ncbi:MAG: XdhC family protein [Pseudomonadales bacterium]|jgi:xanthine dehydrogenase accessory factor|nr:XdhC family protein [Pseudomonadales bacterium]MDP6471327.1 XdhC family protein [Pseudomonadales bacterium]MDP6826482.1 XdhC family protein [Pseudomonadales bacterium]MDP6970063.1 XdhC family protein [Pseudomonadales bacterium]
MQAVDNEVLNQVAHWLREERRCWLATVVQTWGSSPRPVGSLLACDADGHIVGSLSGGCVEDDLLEKLTAGELARDHAQFFQYGITAEETEKLGLPCGGHLYIVVEPLHSTPDYRAHFDHLAQRLARRRTVERSVDLARGTFSYTDVEQHAPLSWDEGAQVLKHTYGPRHQLFIIGAGMVSKYLAELAQMLDYEVSVCDPREQLLEDFAVPGTRLVNDMPDDAVRAHANDPSSAIVALTHDPRIDDMGLMEALKSDAFYIGAMGSTRTSASRRERLAALDLSDAEIARLHAPIGLPIGSKTPPEIAIAVIGEITAVRKRRVAAAREALRAAETSAG